MHTSKRDVLSARNTSLYAPYAYGHTVRVWYTKLYHTRMVCTIRVRYKIRVWYRTPIPVLSQESPNLAIVDWCLIATQEVSIETDVIEIMWT